MNRREYMLQDGEEVVAHIRWMDGNNKSILPSTAEERRSKGNHTIFELNTEQEVINHTYTQR
jgi:hypothetical protein